MKNLIDTNHENMVIYQQRQIGVIHNKSFNQIMKQMRVMISKINGTTPKLTGTG